MVLERILNWLDDRKCLTVLLDGTPAGAPLYEDFDFKDEDSTIVLERKRPGQRTTITLKTLIRFLKLKCHN